MSANIFGERFMGHRQPAWHGLGTVLQERVSASEAVRVAGLDYSVQTIDLPVPLAIDTWVDSPQGPYINDSKIRFLDSGVVAIVRDPTPDDDEYRVLGTAGSGYTVVQNTEIAELIDPFTKEWPVETVGALGRGERVFFTLSGEKFEVLGEECKHFLLVTDGKDGKNGLNVQDVPICVVCQNTLMAAESAATISFSLRHTRKIKDDMVWHMNLINELRKAQVSLAENMIAMGNTVADDTAVGKVINASFPLPTKPRKVVMVERAKAQSGLEATAAEWELTRDIREAFERERERAKELRSAGVRLYEAICDTRPAIGGTVWAAYQVVTELASWRDGPNAERAVVFGSRKEEAKRGYKQAMALVEGAGETVTVTTEA
jgi:phage/plasmid-like protein (TIGR03299 family)